MGRRRLEAAALELRHRGLTYRAIAGRLRLRDRASAWKITNRALRRMLAEPAAAVRKLELARLDELLAAWWVPATEGGDLAAVDRVLRVMDRRAQLLGLYAAPRQDLAPGPPPAAVVLYLPDNGRGQQTPPATSRRSPPGF